MDTSKKILLFLSLFACIVSDGQSWKAGVASIVITPQKNMWMAGHSWREHKSDGKHNDLKAKALAFEDAEGKKGVLITVELASIKKEMSDRIRDYFERKHGLKRDQVIINISHTHNGPVLFNTYGNFADISQADMEDMKTYTNELEEKIKRVADDALAGMKPVKIYSGMGTSYIQVNRRNNPETPVRRLTEFKGPNDFSVPVLRVDDMKGKLIAIVFGYGCHPTVLRDYKWSGDYPGFAQEYLESSYPGVTAFFIQGTGGNQNAYPRRSVSLAKQYGSTLEVAVEAVLKNPMEELAPKFSSAYEEIDIPYAKTLTKEDINKLMPSLEPYQKKWAEKLLQRIVNGEVLPVSYPYPVEAWKLGGQNIFALGGEVLVEYALSLKRLYGRDIFVFGYSNDVMSYIPDACVLEEGGYEGYFSQMTSTHPGAWSREIESNIINAAKRLAEKLNIEFVQ